MKGLDGFWKNFDKTMNDLGKSVSDLGNSLSKAVEEEFAEFRTTTIATKDKTHSSIITNVNGNVVITGSIKTLTINGKKINLKDSKGN